MFNSSNHPLRNLTFAQTQKDWALAPAEFEADQLRILGHPVMQAWESNYMRALAEVVSVERGTILEIGFGMGIASAFIQSAKPKLHVIIEANADVFSKLITFAASAEDRVIPIYGFWEDVVNSFQAEYFDGILFDTYPVHKAQLHSARFEFFEHAVRLLKPGGLFTHYSGEVEFTPPYIALIKNAGFSAYSGTLCEVSPPSDCQYWNEPHLLVPALRK